jgi:hypothetical protein
MKFRSCCSGVVFGHGQNFKTIYAIKIYVHRYNIIKLLLLLLYCRRRGFLARFTHIARHAGIEPGAVVGGARCRPSRLLVGGILFFEG